MSADTLRLRREFELLKQRLDALSLRVATLEAKTEQKKLSLPKKDAKAN